MGERDRCGRETMEWYIEKGLRLTLQRDRTSKQQEMGSNFKVCVTCAKSRLDKFSLLPKCHLDAKLPIIALSAASAKLQMLSIPQVVENFKEQYQVLHTLCTHNTNFGITFSTFVLYSINYDILYSVFFFFFILNFNQYIIIRVKKNTLYI